MNEEILLMNKNHAEKDGWTTITMIDDTGEAFEAEKESHGIKYIMCYTTDQILSIWEDNYEDCIFRGNCNSTKDFDLVTNHFLNI